MNKDTVIKTVLALMFGVGFFSIFKSLFFQADPDKASYQVQVIQMAGANKGLDLQAVGELLKKAETAADFEKLLNSKDNGVNNLDLNGDGVVDYIKVTEFGEEAVRGFSLSSEIAPGQEQELATIKIAKDEAKPQTAVVETQGNPQVYGPNHYYQSSWSGMATGMMLGYLFASHRPYASPYSTWHQPPSYTPYPTRSPASYEKLSKAMVPEGAYTQASSGKFDHIRSPHAGKSAWKGSSQQGKLSSQKSFLRRSPTSERRQGGFGRSPSRGFGVRRSGGFGGGFRRR